LKKWAREIAGQREILSAYGGVKQSDIRGMRAPFLSIGGNKMFKMLHDFNFTYDSSMPVYENRPPSWPYTLDYKIFHGNLNFSPPLLLSCLTLVVNLCVFRLNYL
jgi:hypothetical protein